MTKYRTIVADPPWPFQWQELYPRPSFQPDQQ